MKLNGRTTEKDIVFMLFPSYPILQRPMFREQYFFVRSIIVVVRAAIEYLYRKEPTKGNVWHE